MTKWEPARLCHGELRYAEEPLCLPAVWVAFFSPFCQKGGLAAGPFSAPFLLHFPTVSLQPAGSSFWEQPMDLGGSGGGCSKAVSTAGQGRGVGKG